MGGHGYASIRTANPPPEEMRSRVYRCTIPNDVRFVLLNLKQYFLSYQATAEQPTDSMLWI